MGYFATLRVHTGTLLQTAERSIVPNLLVAHLVVSLVDVAFSGGWKMMCSQMLRPFECSLASPQQGGS